MQHCEDVVGAENITDEFTEALEDICKRYVGFKVPEELDAE